MAKKVKWKIAVAVLAVVVAGSVYCIFFAEEKEGTVQYQTGEEFTENVNGLSADATVSNGYQANSSVTQAFGISQSDEKAQHSGNGENYGTSSENGSGQRNGNSKNPGQADAELQDSSLSLIYVHVCGAVQNPAVYSLSEGSRVCDAVAKAGGFTESAADDYVNQARFLSDGERVYIPKKDELSSLSASQYAAGQSVNYIRNGLSEAGLTATGQEQVPVNINTAGINELTTLPGIGESRAESIIAYRENHGAFSRIEDIMKISGIKGAAYEKIKDRICTGNE